MAGARSGPKLGKGSAFVKARLKRLRRGEKTWEADLRPLPKPVTQSTTDYPGMVVTQADGALLADTHIEGNPTANDMADLLAEAMRRPSAGRAQRPLRIHVRGHPQWRELSKVEGAYRAQLREARRARLPTAWPLTPEDCPILTVRDANRAGALMKPAAGQVRFSPCR